MTIRNYSQEDAVRPFRAYRLTSIAGRPVAPESLAAGAEYICQVGDPATGPWRTVRGGELSVVRDLDNDRPYVLLAAEASAALVALAGKLSAAATRETGRQADMLAAVRAAFPDYTGDGSVEVAVSATCSRCGAVRSVMIDPMHRLYALPRLDGRCPACPPAAPGSSAAIITDVQGGEYSKVD